MKDGTYFKQWYEKNRAKKTQYQRDRAARFRQLLNVLKDAPCTDCGKKYPPYVMDFDHVRGRKKYALSRMTHKCSERSLLEEVAKCELVCANCHRERTHKRGGIG